MGSIASVGKGSRDKGSNYERKTAKALSAWWGAEFHRTPGSGSLHWQSENNVAGDIVVAYTAGFPFVVECKHQEGGWTLESVFLNRHNVKTWWQQVVVDSRRVGRIPLLMFTRNRAEDFVMLPYAEDLHTDLVLNKQPVMRTTVTYTEEMTNTSETFDVMITTLAGFTTFKPLYYQEWAKKHDWESESLVAFPKEEQEETTGAEKIDSILNLIKEEG